MQSALAVFLVFVVPVWDAWHMRRLKRSPDPRKKVRAYLTTAAWLWAASGIVWAMERPGFLYSLRWTARPGWAPGPEIAIGICIGFLAAAVAQVVVVHRNLKMQRAFQKALEKLSFFLPATRTERWLFAGLSITAGICEETLYRGFLMQYFGGRWHLGIALAVVLSSCAFGAGHEYQGRKGILATGALGAIFALLYVVTGSLALVMAVHALIDLRVLAFPAMARTPEAA